MRRRLLLLVAVVAGPSCRERLPPDGPPLYQDLGDFHVPISSSNELAQKYFDQGVRLNYAFNHAEAIRAFGYAAALDRNCAICWWGAALAYGPNINAPMDSAGAAGAWLAITKAKALAPRASDRERSLIEALSARYAEHPGTNRAWLDSAYAAAMKVVAARYPGDLEAATLYAEALMDLRPWAYWDGPGKPAPGTDQIVSSLERVIRSDSTHPGACHFYIHAVESVEPAKAVPCAERLARLMPGAGHLVHRPAHIYVRVGRYREAIELNEHAAHADSVFAATERVSPAYAAIYVPHNFHFLGFAAMLAGDTARTLRSAKATVEKMPVEALMAIPEYQPMAAFEHQMLAKFGRWEEVLALPIPGPELPIARAVAEYTRGVAHLRSGRPDAAARLLDSVTALTKSVGASDANPIAKSVAEITRLMFAAEVAAANRKNAAAIGMLKEAVTIEDGLGYMEPPWWVDPVRHTLGRVMLAARDRRGAARVFQEDLDRFPANVWATAGLARATGRR
jgi:tetratricopeptide (TPR) repeat protein